MHRLIGLGEIDPKAAVRLAELFEAMVREVANLRRLSAEQEPQLRLLDSPGDDVSSSEHIPITNRLPG